MSPSDDREQGATIVRTLLVVAATALLFACPDTRLGFPAITVSVEGVPVANGDSYDLGELTVGEEQLLSLTIKNAGHANLVLSGEPRIGISGGHSGFLRIDGSTPSHVEPQFLLNLDMICLPTGTASSLDVVITIANNDPQAGTFSIRLTGSVAAAEEQRAVTGVELNKSSTEITAGHTEQLVATVTPSDATDRRLTWESDDTGVVTVDSTGLLSAEAPGTATITVTTVDGGFTDECEVTVAAVTYALTVEAESGGSITQPSTSPVTVDHGVATAILASADAEYTFVGWSVSQGSATFADAYAASTTVTLDDGDATITASFSLNAYNLTVDAGTGGTITAPASSPIAVEHGAAIAITAAATTGYSFTGWSVTSGDASIASPASASTTVTLESGDATVSASFALSTYQLTVQGGDGGTITEPSSSAATVDHGAATTITAAATTGYSFTGWSVTSGAASIASPASASTTVTLESGDATVTASFALNTYQLIVGAETGGTITAPAGSPVTVDHGIATNITASADAEYTFVGWSVSQGSATIADSHAASTTVTLENGDATITASFSLNAYTLTVDAGTGGTITAPASSPIAVQHGAATTITTSSNAGSTFSGWVVTVGTAQVTDTSALSTSVTLEAGDATVTAQWILPGGSTITIENPTSPAFTMSPSTFILETEGDNTEETITVSEGAGVNITSYQWLVNGVLRETQSSLWISSSLHYPSWLHLGANTLTLLVEIDGRTYSESFTFQVWQEVQKGYTVDGVDFAMKYVPGGTFPTGTDDSGEATVEPIWIGETEGTNELVAAVYQWAYDEGKMSGGTVDGTTVTLYGQELLDLDGGYIQIAYSGGAFAVDPGYEDYPCVEITWYGAIMLCNWLTEMVDGNADQLVYSGMDVDWIDDETVEDTTRCGFRLPSSDEWECAARYIVDANGDGDIADAGEYYPGDHVSGDSTSYCYPSDGGTSAVFGDYAWYTDNSATTPNSGFYPGSGQGTHPVGTAGNSEGQGTPLTGNANALGIYDMSGNVFEWCSTENYLGRTKRGGEWFIYPSNLRVGGANGHDPALEDESLGFRLSRTPQERIEHE